MTAIFGTTPESVSDLEVIAQLGRGAETVVYRVRRHGEDYALKVLSAADGEHALTMIRREAALLGCVGHPLLPRIFEVGRSSAGAYLVLEYIDGAPLSQVLRRGPLDEDDALRLAIDLVGPLAAAHRAGLVHRDVKPDNVIVERTGTSRLIDFGLAGRGGADDRIAGTLSYCAPEQTGMLKRPVDGRSDLYALGVLLHECVTGRLPYASDDIGELIRLHATAPVPDARETRPDLSPTMAAIIATLMAKDPDDRYQSGDGLLSDLRRLAERPGDRFAVASDRRGVRPIGPTLLVGRDQEVIALANRWLRARDGAGGAAVVEGPAGAGKTRLVRELTNAVKSDGDLVLYGKCVPDDPVPLAPLRGAVERYLRTVERLPDGERERAIGRLTRAAGRGGPLLRTLSPLLADLMQAPRIGELNRQEQFVNAVAAFLVGLADEFQGAVLHIDDVQWLDGPTRRVLQQVTNRLTGTPLLVIATSRDDADSAAALDRFGADMDATLDTRLPLRPLDRDAVIQLVEEHLGGVSLPGAQIAELAERAGGNPFIVGEYVRAVFDAGLIAPTWKGWRLDLAGLDRLELSGDAVDLVLQRIDGLGEESRRLLVAGATAGRWFPAELVAAVCAIDPRHARALLTEAESRRLVTAAGTGGYRFLHDRIREALLVGLDDAALRRMHQRIAEMLDAATFDDPRYVYSTARHYALGETHRRPDRVHLSGLNAGRLALAEHAPAEARTFLEAARQAAESAGLAPQPGFYVALGTSCARTGRFAEALRHLDHALRDEPDKLRRAEIRAQVAQVHNSSWNPDRAFDAVRRGLAEVGRPLPRGRVGLVLTTLVSVLLGLFVGRTHVGFGTARDRSRERYRLQAILYDLGTFALSMRMRRLMRAMMSLRALYPINRLGPGREYAQHMAGLGVIADVAARPALASRLFDRAAAVAAEIGDPELVGYVEWKRGAGSHLGGRDDDSQIWGKALIEHERWLELGDYLTAVGGVCMQFFKRGRTADAEAWLQRAKTRIGPGNEAEGNAIRAVEAVLAAQRGRAEQANAHIEALRRFLRANPDNPMQLINLYGARMVALVEQDQLGEPFDRLTAEFAELGLTPGSIVPEQRVIYVFEALGRLTRCHRAGAAAGPELLAAAGEAVGRLGEKATDKPLRAFHRVTRADLELLRGRPEEAVRTLAGVDSDLLPMDAPLITYEAARVRARAFQALNQPAPAAHEAIAARTIAAEQQWPQRVRWVEEEFPESKPEPGPAPLVTTGGRHAAEGGAAALYRRRLEALQQVSLASATVLDPRELARVALDETLRFLGAERAFLFLLDRDLGQLVPHVGRDGEGREIHEFTGYSATLVDRVLETGEPLVVTGSEEGAALGSHSMQAHGLRSIMIAPLKFDGQLRGLVYLDSRIAKGVFTGDDVAILKAITNHIAVSMETARAAQLEVAVQTASRQRDVAETLRAAMADQSSSLDPDEVMRRLLDSLARTVGGNSAVLLSRGEADGLVVAASHGAAARVGEHFSVPSDLLGLTGPRARTAAPGEESIDELLGSPRSWWAVPVSLRGEPFGILLVGSAREQPITEAQAQTAAAIAGQGMTAYENARLFSQVRRMATVDGLTGVFNRNHFFTEADRHLRHARDYRTPIAAVMVDIDHFKSINDTYGHPVGDEVIRVVADRLRRALGEGDVLGRYGGEEFAVVTPQDRPLATELAERLHDVVSGEPVPTAAGALPVTISLGLACGNGDDPDLQQLLTRADRALYQAKQTGRDRVCIAP
ncbi:diguanylate cyclase [Actinoplanes sp. LDG1-06]|uniref:Diguanylate cyclase n=1 Tax=Paractinoplanes ovalisporus TaxID=2810368 RepID=A0ABS2A4S7_9ACTN|nr:diguanylate cyclase [Actinoplanes ovalisporus]MBM2614807.1 diguanylate cyclase [Actinoplanes ovalisporus]